MRYGIMLFACLLASPAFGQEIIHAPDCMVYQKTSAGHSPAVSGYVIARPQKMSFFTKDGKLIHAASLKGAIKDIHDSSSAGKCRASDNAALCILNSNSPSAGNLPVHTFKIMDKSGEYDAVCTDHIIKQ